MSELVELIHSSPAHSAPEEVLFVPHGDFRRLLQETLVARCKSNPAYSLRAFAKQLQVEPSFLSKLLSGKRNATLNVVMKIGTKLQLDPEETQTYINGIPKTRKNQNQTKAEAKNFQALAMDHFRMIADWYHYAILELTTVVGFQSDAAWVAKKLGINKIEAQSALERLVRLDMLKVNDQGNYENSSGNNTTIGNEFTAVAFHKLQKQVLLQALHALENVPMEKRDQSSMTMAIDPSLLPEAKKRN